MGIDIGDRIKITFTFADITGTPTDPTSVVFKIKPPGRLITTVPVIKETTGVYHVLVTPDRALDWDCRVEGTGTLTAAEEFKFTVNESKFIT